MHLTNNRPPTLYTRHEVDSKLVDIDNATVNCTVYTGPYLYKVGQLLMRKY